MYIIKHFYYYPREDFGTEDFWWLIGLFEGEGSFMCPNKLRPNSPRFSIGMTDEDTIAKAAKLLGMNYWNRLPKNSRKMMYYFDMKGTRAAELMTIMLPYMSKRRKAKIKEALSGYKRREYKRGDFHFASLLNSSDVMKIKKRLHAGEKRKYLQKEYGVGYHVIANIAIGRTWSHLEVSIKWKLWKLLYNLKKKLMGFVIKKELL